MIKSLNDLNGCHGRKTDDDFRSVSYRLKEHKRVPKGYLPKCLDSCNNTVRDMVSECRDQHTVSV